MEKVFPGFDFAGHPDIKIEIAGSPEAMTGLLVAAEAAGLRVERFDFDQEFRTLRVVLLTRTENTRRVLRDGKVGLLELDDVNTLRKVDKETDRVLFIDLDRTNPAGKETWSIGGMTLALDQVYLAVLLKLAVRSPDIVPSAELRQILKANNRTPSQGILRNVVSYLMGAHKLLRQSIHNKYGVGYWLDRNLKPIVIFPPDDVDH